MSTECVFADETKASSSLDEGARTGVRCRSAVRRRQGTKWSYTASKPTLHTRLPVPCQSYTSLPRSSCHFKPPRQRRVLSACYVSDTPMRSEKKRLGGHGWVGQLLVSLRLGSSHTVQSEPHIDPTVLSYGLLQQANKNCVTTRHCIPNDRDKLD